MQTDDVVTFGDLLRHFRNAAGLTQEALAELAGLSASGIGALEGGLRKRPQKDTVRALVKALELSEGEANVFWAAARGQVKRVAGPGGLATGLAPVSSGSHAQPRTITQGAIDAALEGLGQTPRAQVFLGDFAARYSLYSVEVLKRAAEIAFTILLWRPLPESGNLVAQKRNHLHVLLQSLEYTVNSPFDGSKSWDLIIVIVEDDPNAIRQALDYCRELRNLPSLYTAFPLNQRDHLSGILDPLIRAYRPPFWYEDLDVQISNLVGMPLDCARMRCLVKAALEV